MSLTSPTTPNILSPAFSQTPRRSGTVSTGYSPVSGRWVTKDASGLVISPTTGQGNAYLVLEGLKKVSEVATYGATDSIPSQLVQLPSAVAGNEVALAHGIFVYEVSRNGVAYTVLAQNPGTLLYLITDESGNPGGALLTNVNTGGSSVAIAVLEKVSGQIATIRTLANA